MAVLLKDQLFNPESVEQLAGDFARGVPGFDRARFVEDALAGFPERELMARLDWLADCAEAQLPADFPDMVPLLHASMAPRLDPTRKDDDFGRFIHAVPGILAARHGLEEHREAAMQVLYEATQRFSMEFWIRDFLIRWPSETLADLARWAGDDNYHVRRLVSEGTRPRLPWARAVGLTPEQTLPLLDRLAGDSTRFVTRSVANHLNDLSRIAPDRVIAQLDAWSKAGRQTAREMTWMTRHALRTLIKNGHPEALALLGYSPDAPVDASVTIDTPVVAIGDRLAFSCRISATGDLPVLVDYRIRFARPGGKTAEKVFKLRQSQIRAGQTLELSKEHPLKGNATTFTLHPGEHHLTLQINGRDRASAAFTVVTPG
ncbi:DNA alkylation repair protein [uncultured Roseobacter sp.]|uniref:DNA alkylation repair protein n=1 Tax=uncultured Roseobacter sp. TaxID=114847 RepID=UPI00261B78EA|nr:DNA alkylation repair protein [uncultured Roseobacter sp.]